jgi:hypothetical protein
MIALLMLASLITAPQAHADLQLLPKNSHQLYQTYGLLRDFQSSALFTSSGAHRAGLGGTFALAGDTESLAHPELMLLASMDSSVQENSGGGLGLDSLDVRLGGAIEWALNSMMRFSVGVIYTSGHVADGVTDVSLRLHALSDVRAFGRFIYDLGPYARATVTLAPIFHSSPDMQTLSASQSLEVHPFSGADDPQKPSLYAAIGLTQEGTEEFGLQDSFHAQIGAYLGNHFSADAKPTLRPVVGYYTGADPALKQFRLHDETVSFFYAGLMFDF